MHARDAPRFAGVGLDEHLLVGRKDLAGAEDRTRQGRVVGRDEIGMRAIGLVGCERQHLRAECGKQTTVTRGWRMGAERRGVHAIEIRAHRR